MYNFKSPLILDSKYNTNRDLKLHIIFEHDVKNIFFIIEICGN